MSIEDFEVTTPDTEVATVSEEEIPAEESEQEEVVEDETEEDTEEGESEEVVDEKPKKKTANERIQELIEQRNKEREETTAKLAEMEAKLKEIEVKEVDSKYEKPLDMDRVNDHIREIKQAIAEKELAGDDWAAEKLRDELSEFKNDVKEYTQKHSEHKTQKEKSTQEKNSVAGKLQALETAANLYKDTLKIPQDMFDKMSDWFALQCRDNPLLGREFAETVMYQGELKGIKFVHEYAQKNMGKEAKEVKQKKEAAKSATVGGASTASGPIATPKTFDALMKLSDTAIEKFIESNPKEYDRLLKQKIGR